MAAASAYAFSSARREPTTLRARQLTTRSASPILFSSSACTTASVAAASSGELFRPAHGDHYLGVLEEAG
jgi:hypothetical protein